MNKPKKILNKDFAETTPVKPLKQNKKWTLLLVGDHGEIKYIRNFIGVMMTLLIALIIAVSIAVFYIVIYKSAKNENEDLLSALNTARDQALSLRKEQDLLLVRLVVAEQKNKALTTELKIDKKGKQVKSKKIKISSTQQKISKSVKTVQKKAIKKSAPAVVPEKKLKVAVDNFSCSISSNNSIIKIKFKLMNKSLKSRSATGYTFVILSNNRIDKNKWFIFPQAKLLDGKPAIIKKGRFFSISRYNIIKFNRKTPIENIESFNEAKVCVYDVNGNLLIKKIFPFSAKLNRTALPLNTEQTPAIEPVVKKKQKLPVQTEEEQKIRPADENVSQTTSRFSGKNVARESIRTVKTDTGE
ncbi:MAG: hypothetical protein JJV89_04350 [Desulfosarcina sp.]|nr:hypothetical protein [Desulfobacterales bacterium]